MYYCNNNECIHNRDKKYCFESFCCFEPKTKISILGKELQMFKEWMLTVLMVLFLALTLVVSGGCRNDDGDTQVTTWLYGDQEATSLRMGTMVSENGELGVVTNYYPNEDNDSQMWGVYGIYHIPGEYPVMNPFEPGETLVAFCSYLGIQTTMDDNYDDQLSLFAGYEFWDIFFAEVQLDAYDNKASVRDDEVRGVLGVRKVFKF